MISLLVGILVGALVAVAVLAWIGRRSKRVPTDTAVPAPRPNPRGRIGQAAADQHALGATARARAHLAVRVHRAGEE